MTPELARLIQAAKKEVQRLLLSSKARELHQVLVKLEEAEMWERAGRVGVEERRREARSRDAAPRWSSARWVRPELG